MLIRERFLIVIATEYQLPAAEAYMQQGIVMMREINDRQNLALYLNNQGSLFRFRGDFASAEKAIAESLEIYQAIGDRRGLCFALTARARLTFAQSNLGATIADAEETLRIRRELEDRETIADSHTVLGMVALETGDYAGAEAAFLEALKVSEETGARDGIVESRLWLAFSALAKKDAAAARSLLRSALDGSNTIQSVPTLIELIIGIAQLHLLEGRAERSAELVGLIDAHPMGSMTSIQYWIKPLHKALEAAIPPDVLAAAVLRGKMLNFEQMTKTLDKEVT